MTSYDIEELKRKIVQACRILIDRNLSFGSSGNISARIPGEEKVIITPSAVPLEKISPDDLLILDMEGNVVEGDKNPSVETPLHLTIYRNRSDVNAIIHAHPIYSSALATTHTSIPPILDEVIHQIGGEVSVSEYALPGTKELAKNVLRALGKKKAVILANHGVVTCGI